MSSIKTNWILELTDNVSGHLKSIDGNVKKITISANEMTNSLKESSAVNIQAIVQSISDVRDKLMGAVQPGIRFQSALAEVEAITGVTGSALEELGNSARETAKRFGGSASDSLENYKIILSKLGPEIASSKEALKAMNEYAIILSKTMGGDTRGAVDALTTSMLQFRVDLSDPVKASKEMANMMNVMAAGAKYGSAEVTEVSQAIKVAGVAASQANVSFEETIAAIQELSRGGKKGAEAGVALRNILGKMAGEDVIPKEAADKLKALGVDMSIVSDKSLPLTTRLRELGKAQADATIYAQMFGVENEAAARILIRSVDAQDDLKQKITGTNTATEQADVIMETYAEKIKRWKAKIEDFGIGIFNSTQNYIPFIDYGTDAIKIGADLKNSYQGLSMLMNTKMGKGFKSMINGLKKATKWSWKFVKPLAISIIRLTSQIVGLTLGGFALIGSYVSGLVSATAAQLGFNIAVSANPIGLIVIGVAAAVSAVVVLIKYWDEIKTAIWNFTKFVWKISPFKFIIDLTEKIFPGFKKKIEEIFSWVKDKIMAFWESIKEVFGKVANFFGFGDNDKAEVEVTGEVKDNTDYSKKLPGVMHNGELDKVAPSGQINSVTDYIKTGAIKPSSISGSSGAGRSLTMNLDIKNIFNLTNGTKQDIENIADQVVGRIVDKLRDAEISMG